MSQEVLRAGEKVMILEEDIFNYFRFIVLLSLAFPMILNGNLCRSLYAVDFFSPT